MRRRETRRPTAARKADAVVRETWTYDELFEGLDPAPAFVAELERQGLLHVVARDGAGRKLYAADAHERLERVLELVELGYQPKDIAAIARRVGLPRRRRRLFRRPPTYLRMTELARRAGVELDVVEAWHERGIVRPALRTEGGEALFSEPTVEGVRALADLLAFGFSLDEIARMSALGRQLDEALAATRARQEEATTQATGGLESAEPGAEGTAPPTALGAAEVRALATAVTETLGTIRRRTERLRGGIRRWDKLLAAYDKRVERLERAAGVEPAERSGGRQPKAAAKRSGRRRRLRTARRTLENRE